MFPEELTLKTNLIYLQAGVTAARAPKPSQGGSHFPALQLPHGEPFTEGASCSPSRGSTPALSHQPWGNRSLRLHGNKLFSHVTFHLF